MKSGSDVMPLFLLDDLLNWLKYLILYFINFLKKFQVVEMHKHFALLMTTTFGLGVMVIMENWAVEGQMDVKYPWRSTLWLALVLLRYPNSSFETTSNE